MYDTIQPHNALGLTNRREPKDIKVEENMFSVACVYYGYSTRGCIHLQERCNIFQSIGANTSPAAKGSTLRLRVSGRPVLQIIRQADRSLLDLTKTFHCALQDKKYSIILWNTHCEDIIPADMTDMTVDTPFCAFESNPTLFNSSYVILHHPPVACCKLFNALLARTLQSTHL